MGTSKVEAEKKDDAEVDLLTVLQHVMNPRDYIYDSIDVERDKQEELWGESFDNMNTPNDWITYMMHYLSKAVAMDRKSGERVGHVHFDGERFAINMQKALAIGVASLETLARNGTLANRHYDLIGKKG